MLIQIALAYVGIDYTGVGDFVLIKDPSSPALVHGSNPALVKTDARQMNFECCSGGDGSGGTYIIRELAGDGRKFGVDAFLSRYIDRSRICSRSGKTIGPNALGKQGKQG